MEALKLMNARLEQLLKAHLKPVSPDEPVSDSQSILSSKESARAFEKKRRRTPPELSFCPTVSDCTWNK